MKIQFKEKYKVKDHIGKEYQKGDVLDCNRATASHFINKGIAEEIITIKSKSATTYSTEKPVDVDNSSKRPKLTLGSNKSNSGKKETTESADSTGDQQQLPVD